MMARLTPEEIATRDRVRAHRYGFRLYLGASDDEFDAIEDYGAAISVATTFATWDTPIRMETPNPAVTWYVWPDGRTHRHDRNEETA